MQEDFFKKSLQRLTNKNTYINLAQYISRTAKKLYENFISVVSYTIIIVQEKLETIPDWPIREKAHKPILRFGLVFVLCAIILLLKQIISPLFVHEPAFLLFYSVIVVSAWYGGTRPGILAIILSSFLAYFLYLQPLNPTSSLGNILAVLLFILEGLLIVGVNFVMHQTLQIYEEKKRYSQYYANIAQHISDAVISTDMNFVIQSWNEGAEALYGWKQHEVLGKPMDDIIQQVYQISLKKNMQEVLQQEGSWKGEVVHKRKNGSRVHVLTSMSLLHDEDRNPLGIVSVHRDITDRKKLEQGKDDFIALASHELKTPLTSIKLYSGILKQRFEKAEDKASLGYLSKIDMQMTKLLELVNHLLDTSKVQAGKIQFQVEEVSYDGFVKEVVKDIQQINSTHKIIIEGKTDKTVMINRDRLRQVIVNLLNNAIKYSDQADKVIVYLDDEGSRIKTSVQDFGIGIPKEKQDKIFERFYQVTDAKGYTFSGIGLGLYISREIIEKHNGKLHVQSEEGKGSTFFFTLPTVMKHEKGKNNSYHRR